jgi:hypothetical protein
MQHRGGGWGSGFIPIAEYGSEFLKGSSRKAVRLLFSGKNHYDLLLWGIVSMKEEKETLYQYDSSHTQSFTSVNVILIL